MKLATYEKDLQQRIGAVVDDGAAVIDLKAAAGAESRGYLDTMLSLIEAGGDGMAIARMALERESAPPDAPFEVGQETMPGRAGRQSHIRRPKSQHRCRLRQPLNASI